MSLLSKEKLISSLVALGQLMKNPDETLSNSIEIAEQKNAWFTNAEIKKALLSLGEMLSENDLIKWFAEIKITNNHKKVGLILAGNIPMVGFHDVLCVLATGNIAIIKMASADDQLLPTLLKKWIDIEPLLAKHIEYVERLKDFDAIIATGSNNTSRYFNYYFGKVPNIIRKNRNSVAIISGNETSEQIGALGKDMFDYFGLGCRNVSKVYFPEGYAVKNFFEPIESFQPIINHFKYNNNYDYNKSIYLVNGQKHFDNGFLLLKEDKSIASPLAVVFFEYYNDLGKVEELLNEKTDQVQCIVSGINLKTTKKVIDFGEGQRPKLWDYADDINTIEFLKNLNSLSK